MVGEIALVGALAGPAADLRVRSRSAWPGAVADSLPPVLRFAAGALGVTEVRWSTDNTAPASDFGLATGASSSLVVTS
ncbi:MAG: hypothetical protein J0I34_07650 [Pseudonocardia sp.]|uniref:hypothetical protein n=1 Tax=unclassified Pseudonocardia TaxID=2619320 RepID=UPI00086DF9A7|nr:MULTISPECIES: hypothetical protein [unclassified Pseudonocardia]MBN9108643.1 hypothetical protein [Pseudonocardia sp.]ODV07724.1 MAG: hypothetical protein ABT15_06490 [Pseudonocardia sp. SCN 73-27]